LYFISHYVLIKLCNRTGPFHCGCLYIPLRSDKTFASEVVPVEYFHFISHYVLIKQMAVFVNIVAKE
jgi:hypothetical protein